MVPFFMIKTKSKPGFNHVITLFIALRFYQAAIADSP